MTRDLRLIYAYRIISRLYFHLPVLLVFFLVEGISVFVAELLLAVYGLAVTVGSTLLPRFRDRFTCRQLIAGGEVLKLVGLALVVLTGAAWAAAIGQAINGLGYAITQGTDARLLAAVAPDKETNARAQANTQSYMFLSVLAAGIVGAAIFDVNSDAVFFASMGAALISAAIMSVVVEPAGRERPAAASPAQPAVSLTADQRWWVNYYVMLRAVTLAVFVGFLPYFFFEIRHISLTAFGVVLGIFSLAAFLGARFAVKLLGRIGTAQLTVATLLLSVGSVAAFATEPPLALALVVMLIFGLSAGGVRPLTMNGLGPGAGAIVPTMERRFGVVNAGLLIAGGGLLDASNYQTVMVALAAGYAVVLSASLMRPASRLVMREQT